MRRLVARPSSWRSQGFEVRSLEAGGGSAVQCIDGVGASTLVRNARFSP